MTVQEMVDTFEGSNSIEIYDFQKENGKRLVETITAGASRVSEPYAARKVKGWHLIDGDVEIRIRKTETI